MYLGELIAKLTQHDRNKIVPLGFGFPHSYRGNPNDLVFEPIGGTTVGVMLDWAMEAEGATYRGWKGGSYLMNTYTNVWLAHHGCEGETLGPVLLSYMLGEIRND